MTALLQYDAARAALAQAKTFDDVMGIREEMEHVKLYGRQVKDKSLIAEATEIQMRADRRLGELLIAAENAGLIRPGRPKKRSAENPTESEGFTLAEAGIDYRTSSRTQKAAGIPEPAFEAMITGTRERITAGAAIVIDAVAAQVHIDQTNARRDLQQNLSDESAKLATSGRKFPVLYADPATKFRAGIGNRSIENHYRTMSFDELCDLGGAVQSRCLPNCQGFIWSTVPQLANTIARLLPAWGFHYSSSCVWDKTDADHEKEQGTGLVFRNQHEILIYALRGKPPGPAVKPLSIHRERKREHSRKPDYYRQMIADMTRNLPVLEMFARVDDEHPLPHGWESWGNESTPQPEDEAA